MTRSRNSRRGATSRCRCWACTSERGQWGLKARSRRRSNSRAFERELAEWDETVQLGERVRVDLGGCPELYRVPLAGVDGLEEVRWEAYLDGGDDPVPDNYWLDIQHGRVSGSVIEEWVA